MGVLRQLEDMRVAPDCLPIRGTARVISLEQHTRSTDGRLSMRVEIQIESAAGDSCVLVTSHVVPDEYTDRAIPGTALPVWVEGTDPANLVIDWDDEAGSIASAEPLAIDAA
jgi:hypothetical protein